MRPVSTRCVFCGIVQARSERRYSPRMTLLAWAMLALLGFLLTLGASVSSSPLGFAVLGAVMLTWFGLGVLVRRDARRLGFDDPDWAGGLAVVLGLAGLLFWFGYRRGRIEHNRDESTR